MYIVVVVTTLVVAIAGFVSHPTQRLYQVLGLVALSLLFLGTLVTVRRARTIIQVPVYVGITLVVIAVVAVQASFQTQLTSPQSAVHCSLFAGPTLTPTPPIQPGLCFATGVCTPTPTPRPRPKPAPTPTLSTALDIAAKWPQSMNITNSEFAGIALKKVVLLARSAKATPAVLPVGGKPCKLSAQRTAAPQRVNPTPVSVGTPGVPLQLAFGPHYQEVDAAVKLAAINFDVTPNSVEWQSLDQTSDEWGWTITPKQAGQQVIIFAVDLRWNPAQQGKGAPQTVERQIWESDPKDVNVQEDRVTWGQLQIGPLVSGALAAAFASFAAAFAAWFFRGGSSDTGK